MTDISLRGLDLNLLLTLHVLIEERQVSRAASRLGLTQPAVSHALGRLREQFGDPLLVRRGKEMVLTPRALDLAGPLRQVLSSIQEMTGPAGFDPRKARGTLRIATTDYGLAIVLPHVLSELAQAAPQLSIAYSDLSEEMFGQLKNGFLDIALTGQASYRDMQSEPLFTERFVLVTRADHPLVGRPMTVEDFVAWPHVMIDVVHSRLHDIDARLERMNKRRHIALRMPHFHAAAFFAQKSDLIVPVLERVALLYVKSLGLAIHQPPPELDLGRFDYVQLWHERRNNDPLHRWVRKLINNVGARIREQPIPVDSPRHKRRAVPRHSSGRKPAKKR
ncbi:MAG: LysR family transcriptional regulator [Steroidobacteraceae bacterium]